MVSVGETVRALPLSGVNQTSFLFGAVLFAYLFFITVRGDLAKWLGLLGLSGSGSGVGTAVSQNSVTANQGLPSLSGLPALPQVPGVANIPTGGV